MSAIKKINGLTREQAVELAYKIGFESEASKTNCSQATFHAVSTVLGIKNPQIFRSLYSLAAGGASSTCGSCGAFSGALVCFGFFLGRTYEQWDEGKIGAKSAILAHKFFKRFEERFQSVVCRDIHQKLFNRTFDLYSKDDLKDFEEMGAHTVKCPTVVGLGSAWAVDILWEYLPGDKDVSKVPDISEALY
jgi:C_GCAxxG_C_C family probable redox protein